MFFIVSCVVLAIYTTAYIVRRFRHPYLTIQGKHICITGGSEGIGLSIAQECVRRGASTITLLARNPKKLETATEQLLTTAGPYQNFLSNQLILNDSESDIATCTILAFSCDVTNAMLDGKKQERIEAAKSAGLIIATTTNGNPVPKCIRPVDILINCAGACICDHFDSLTAHELEQQMKLNICGTLHPCQEMVKFIKSSPSKNLTESNRVIVLMGSLASQVNIYGFVSYGASKFAIKGIWEALSMECDPINIRVVCVFPPNTETPGFEIECQRKPEITKLIEDTPGLYSSDEVAEVMINGIQKGQRRITFGYMGWLLAALTAGFSPASDMFEILTDLLLTPFLRFVAVALSYYWMTIVRTHTKFTKSTNSEKNKIQ